MDEGLQGGVFESRSSSTLRLHSASNMAVPDEMDCRQPSRFAGALAPISVFLKVALR